MRRIISAAVCGTLILGALTCELHAQVIVVNDNVQLDYFGNHFALTVKKSVNDDSGGTSAEFVDDRFQQSISGIGGNVDEGSDWYLVQPGDLFSRAAVSADEFPLVFSLSEPDMSNTVYVGPEDFYLGVRTGIGYGYPQNRTAYGWVHLGRNPTGQLTMLENVMSYDNYGIFVGTTQIIPEPNALAMMVCAAGLLAAIVRRSRVVTPQRANV